MIVPGLAEKRPSVLKGDSIHLSLARQSDRWFEGRVLDIESRAVVLSFHEDFKYHARDTCEVRFTVNRLIIRRMHDAIQTAGAHLGRIFFPSNADLRNATTPLNDDITATWFDTRIATNRSQLQAVKAIVNSPPRSIPYIVFGP